VTSGGLQQLLAYSSCWPKLRPVKKLAILPAYNWLSMVKLNKIGEFSTILSRFSKRTTTSKQMVDLCHVAQVTMLVKSRF
jgi:hypothetical protein